MENYDYTITLDERQKSSGMLDMPVNFRDAFNVRFAYRARFTINGTEYETYINGVGGDLYKMRKNTTLLKNFEVGEILNISLLPIEPIFYTDSPYSFDNPVRGLDSVEYVRQPTGFLCGQSCVAMLAARPIDEVCRIMCTDKGTNIEHIKAALSHYGIRHAKSLVKYKGETPPGIAIYELQLPMYKHWTLCFKGKFYDPEFGVIDGFSPESVPLRYLEIFD